MILEFFQTAGARTVLGFESETGRLCAPCWYSWLENIFVTGKGVVVAKYHINPDTGEVGACRARTRCPFGDLEEDHYASRADATRAYEKAMTEQTFQTLTKDAEPFPYTPQGLRETAEVWRSESTSEEDRERIVAWWKSRDINNAFHALSVAKGIEYDAAWEEERATRSWTPLEKTAPPREEFSQAIGLREAQKKVLADQNTMYTPGDYLSYYNAEEDLDGVLDRYAAGETASRDPDQRWDDYPHENKLLHLVSDPSNSIVGQKLYLATAFPEKDLRPVVERLDIGDFSVGSFDNSREWGLTYTVMTPEGSTRTFAVYEHRNTDSIIINGKENWDPRVDRLPYAQDSKNAFFAEVSVEDFPRVAESLGFFMKEAQRGELPSDDVLVAQADHLDWNEILARDIPGFKDWLEERDPDAFNKPRWFED